MPREVANSYWFWSCVVQSHEDTALVTVASQASLDIENGPLFSVDVTDRAGEQLLFLVAHHLVIDLVSWRGLLQDFEQLLEVDSIPPNKLLSFLA